MASQRPTQKHNFFGPSDGKADPASSSTATPVKEDELEASTNFFIKQLKQQLTDLAKGNKSQALMVNIHGAWGSGKSHILEKLYKSLCEGDKWIIIRFNAWQHQRLGSPWWWLITAVSLQSIHQLRERDPWRAFLQWVRQRMWYLRFTSARWLPYLLISFGLFVLSLLMIIYFGPLNVATAGAIKTELQSIATGAQSVTAILTTVSAIITLCIGLARAIVPGPVNTTPDAIHDPMQSISKHFELLIHTIEHGRTVSGIAFFIEDLDRCQSNYVVELLEGIQTLFLQPNEPYTVPVCYVVAADQRWICASFEKVYGTFAKSLEEPGRPSGYMFVEKAFHVTTSVPPLSKPQYLLSLLQQEQRRKNLGPETTFEHILKKTLDTFLPNGDTSPRTITRIVDACIFRKQSLQKSNFSEDELEQLVLWTLIDIQWPLIAEYLGEHPGKISAIKKNNWDEVKITSIAKETLALMHEDKVQNVVKHLKEDAVSYFTSLYPIGFMRVS